ncbi:MAG TPA: pilus assembly protein N-terminal domain-containing protein, partial [Solimonas sp.]|nr:pilus assembly protein N-terminal domain-containing protein [Solimonas sp.]
MNNKLIRACWIALAACMAQPALAAPVPGTSDANILLVEEGTHKLQREPAGVTRVTVGNPDIADVQVINKREFLVTGKKIGVTSLMVWTRGAAQPREYRVRVGAVRDPLRTSLADPELARALGDPGRGLEGHLPNLMAHRRAKIAAAAAKDGALADRSQVDLETQVMTDVKVAEISRTTAQQFGLNFGINKGSTTAGIYVPGSFSGVSQEAGAFTLNSGSGFLPLQNAFSLIVGDASKGILGLLSLLERKGLARTLAEPSLVASSGQTASYLAGGEFPVPVSQGGANAGGITIQFKEFGVRLNLTPTVLSRDRISLKVAPEVSDLDFSAGIQIGGVAVPALTVRRTDTTVELGDGESFVVSGLVSSNLINSVSKVPWLGDLP